MEIVIISAAAFITAILTFFSGFGLGTILMPVFAIFFPLDVAIAITALIHLLNNLLKVALIGKNADRSVLIRFGIPAVIAAFAGAWVLIRTTTLPAIYTYSLAEKTFQITPIKLIIAIILIVFALIEITPALKKIQFDKNKLIIGGILSGFLGGLSGIQGALRSAFLIKIGLSKEAFIATTAVIAAFVDISRISVYAVKFTDPELWQNLPLILAAIFAATAGTLIGKKLLNKITLQSIQIIVAIMLISIAAALATGLI